MTKKKKKRPLTQAQHEQMIKDLEKGFHNVSVFRESLIDAYKDKLA
jgi:hypothetical protein